MTETSERSGSEVRWSYALIGPFEVTRDGRTLGGSALGSRKQRQLLKLLLVERGHFVSIDRIVEALWSDPPERPQRLVATLVSRLRATFGRAILQGGPEAYCLVAGGDAVVDLDEATSLVLEAEEQLAGAAYSLARAAAERARVLLERGDILEDEPYAEWLEAVRSDARRLLRRARSVAWRASLATDDASGAIAAAERAVADDPFDEDAYRALMLANRASGRRAEAMGAYERLRISLETELGVEPATATRELYTEIAGTSSAAVTPQTDATLTRRKRLSSREPTLEALDPSFVGREAELDRLAHAWSAAAAGSSSLILLTGEAGIGKSTLGSRLMSMARATGGLVLESRCYEAERSLFLQPIADALRPLILRSSTSTLRGLTSDGGLGLARVAPELPAAIGTPIPEPTIPELELRRAFDSAAGLIRSLAGRQPVLLYIDDLHLAGAATLEFVHFMVRRASPSRLLAVATVRVEEGDEVRRTLADVASVIDVGPLPGDVVRRLAATMGSGEVAERVIDLTRGHPLFVVEILRALAERATADSTDSPPIPETLRAAVLERVERAGGDVADLLSGAAVLGSKFALDLVAALLELPVEEIIRRAELGHRARLLVPVGAEFAFSNDLTHEIVYGASPLPVRMLRHRRAAALLAGHPELVANHAAAAESWPDAAAAWLAAAAEATAHYANHDAERLLDRALDAAGRAASLRLEARVRLARGRVRETLGKYAEAVGDAGAAVELSRQIGDRRLEMEGLRDMGGDPLIALGRTPEACIPYLQAALAIAEELSERGIVIDILRRLAVIETNCLRGADALRYADAALASARTSGDELALAAALDAAKTVAAYSGDTVRLDEILGELLPIEEREGLTWFRQWAVFESSFVPLARADWQAAEERIQAAIELNHRTGYRPYEAMFLAQLAQISAAKGELGRAIDIARASVREAADSGHPWWSAFAASVLGRILIDVGAPERAYDTLAAGLEAADRDGTQLYVLRCLGPLAEAEAILDRREAAIQHAERAERLVPPIAPGPIFLHPFDGPISAGRAWIALGAPERAVPILREVFRASEDAGWVEAAAEASLAIACAHVARGEDAAAERDLRRALELAGTRLPRVSAEAGAGLAALLERAGDGDDAARAADAAGRLFAALSASIDDVEMRAVFEALAARRMGRFLSPLVG